MEEESLENVTFIKPLPGKLRKNGFDYTRVLKGNKSVIFEQRFMNHIIGYEVFLIKIKPARTFKGDFKEARERFPHDEAFGIWAWACTTIEEAIQKFDKIELQVK